MKQIEHLLEDLETQLLYRAKLGLSWRVKVMVASQNEQPVKMHLARLYYNLLRGADWDTNGLSESEITIRQEHFQKDVATHFRIVVDVKVKEWPVREGNYIAVECSRYDSVFYDMDTCEGYLAYLARNS